MWGSPITLEYHALNSNTHWLPRKMLTHDTWEGHWLAIGDDAGYGDPNVGRWIIDRA